MVEWSRVHTGVRSSICDDRKHTYQAVALDEIASFSSITYAERPEIFSGFGHDARVEFHDNFAFRFAAHANVKENCTFRQGGECAANQVTRYVRGVTTILPVSLPPHALILTHPSDCRQKTRRRCPPCRCTCSLFRTCHRRSSFPSPWRPLMQASGS